MSRVQSSIHGTGSPKIIHVFTFVHKQSILRLIKGDNIQFLSICITLYISLHQCSTLKIFLGVQKMSGKAEYKSAIRSRKMIRHAFVELILEKELEKITVKSIVEKAEISRGTFYAHYSDIYAVIEEIENETMSKMIEFLNDFEDVDLLQNPMPFLLKMEHFFKQDIEFYRMLIYTKGAPTFITKLKAVLMEKILSYKENIHSIQEREEYILNVNFIVSGLVSLYQDWFAGKVECSLEELTTSVNRIMIKGN